MPLNKTFCYKLALAKTHRASKPKKSYSWTNRRHDLLHFDLCSPFKNPLLGGSRYFFTIADHYSRRAWTFFLKHKSDTLTYFTKLYQQVNITNDKIQSLQTDRGCEFVSIEFLEFCKRTGIKQLTVPHTPYQNRVAGHKNRTILDRARSMALDAELPHALWLKVVATATYLTNVRLIKA